MNTLDNINLYKIEMNNGIAIATSALRYVINSNTKDLISIHNFCPVNVSFDPKILLSNENRFTLNIRYNEEPAKVIQFEETEDYATTLSKQVLNMPTSIRCQNCETCFPTKYQYRRHQCEFNAEKVILKSDVGCKEVDNGIPEKYVCDFCNKQFANGNNLARHQSSHENTKENICEHCNKQFITENRLRIHKENYCKKAGDVSEFYRSDVTVWKCKKCHEVFSFPLTANYHVSSCIDMVELDGQSEKLTQPADEDKKSINDNSNSNKEVAVDDKNIERVFTKVLLQCEFCNRTYTDKNMLLMHQRKHTTSRNYECVNCFQVFESYPLAAQHWMQKCSENVSIFFLPKLMYCEYCDRTFKSHELLYTHKIKKKHYTSKLHLPNTEETNKESDNSNVEQSVDNKEVLNKHIEDVLKSMDVPADKINYPAMEDNKENVDRNNEGENKNCLSTTEKKKRGRKRKWPNTQCIGVKKLSLVLHEGFKYQCERCVKVFSNNDDLEAHREKEHASNFKCEECGQVIH